MAPQLLRGFVVIRSSFFWRLYLALALLAGSTAAGIGFVATRQLEHDFSAQIATRLRTQAAALLPLADRAFSRAEDLSIADFCRLASAAERAAH